MNEREYMGAQACYEAFQQLLAQYGCRAFLAAFVKITEDVGRLADKPSTQVIEDLRQIMQLESQKIT